MTGDPIVVDTHTSFLFDAELLGGHVHVKVRAATRVPSVEVDHSRGLCGTLVMSPVEWLLLRAALECVDVDHPSLVQLDGARLCAPAGMSGLVDRDGFAESPGQQFIEIVGCPE